MRSFSKTFDWMLMVPTLALSLVSLVILFSINLKDESLVLSFNPWNQLIYVIVGFAAMLSISRVEVVKLSRYSTWFYLLGLAFMGLVLVMDPVKGASRWIDLGFFQFQPTEVMKLAEIVILARLFSKRGKNINKPWIFLLSIFYAALPAGLAMLQPDLGTAAVFGFIWLVMISMSPVKKYYLILMILLGLAAMPIAYQHLEPYQQQRVMTFIHPAADPQGSGYNTLQATIAIGSGQLFGRGLSGGSQSQLNFLPEQQTDFIFSVIAEKLGFLGAMTVIVGLFWIISRSITLAWKTPDTFSMYVVSGIVALISFHSLINIGMNLGLLPVTGIPLPFLSYGGTHVIMGFAMVGIMQSIGKQRYGLVFEK